jgi:hypothetical protein
MPVLSLFASALAGFRGLGFHPDFRPGGRSGDHRIKFAEAFFAIASLIPEKIAGDHQIAREGDLVYQPPEKARSHFLGKTWGIREVPPEDCLAIDLVDVLSARTRASNVG